MTYLPSLIKKIEKFCRLAEDFSTVRKTAAPNPWDDPNFGMGGETDTDEEGTATTPYFDDLVKIARQVDDPELSQQLEILAELYRYSLQIGGGYATIAKAINNLKNMYSDGSDSTIEFILNGMIGELAKAAGSVGALTGKDNPNFVQRLAQLKQDIEARTQEGRSEALDAYQEEVGGQGRGAQTEDTEEELAQAGITPEQAEIINPAAMGFGQKDDPKTNKGWHTVGSGKPYKNWKEYYNNEKLSYEADLANEQDPNVRKALEDLIAILPVLSEKTEKALELSNALRSDVGNPTAEARMRTALDTMRQELQEIKKTRLSLKDRIRSTQIKRDQEKLSDEKNLLNERYERLKNIDPEKAEKARREKYVLEQRIALNDLSLSTDVYRSKERNYRLELIRQMTGGAWPSQDWINKQLQKIEDASKTRISHSEYDRARTEQIAKQQGRIPTKRDPQRGGWGTNEKRINLNKDTSEPTYFPLLVGKIGPSINTAVAGASYYIARAKEGGNAELKPNIEAVSAAIRKKNNAAKYEAIRALKEATKNYLLRKKNAVDSYEIAIRLTPYFRKIEERIKHIASYQKEGQWNLDESQYKYVLETTDYIAKIIRLYNLEYKDKKSNFDSFVIELLPKIKEYFEKHVLKIQDYKLPTRKRDLERQQIKSISYRMELLQKLGAGENNIYSKEYRKIYDRERSLEKAKQKGKITTPVERDPQKGGWGEHEKRDLYDHDLASFFGMVELLQDKINTGIHYTRLRLTRPKEGGDPILKPYVDAVAKAILDGNVQAKYEAIKTLRQKISETAVSDTALQTLLHSNRLLPFFYQIRDDLKSLKSLKDKKSGDWYINDDAKQLITKIIDRTNRLQAIRNKYYDQFRLYFDRPLLVLSDIVDRLNNLLQYKPRITP
jgi:hypothetical protein